MQNIEFHPKNTQLLFSKSLSELAIQFSIKTKNKIPDKNNENNFIIDLHEEEITLILFHFFKSISTLERSISEEYSLNLHKLLNVLFKNKYKINIAKDIIDFANNLGKFGQNFTNRSYSVLFCVSLLRISESMQDDLIKRILFLCEDTDHAVKIEMVYQMRYFIKECCTKFCREKIAQFIYVYFDENEILLRILIIDSILVDNNLQKFINQKKFCEILIKKIDEIIDIDDYHTLTNDFEEYKKIFLNMINCSLESEQYRKLFINNIKHYLMVYFINRTEKKYDDDRKINLDVSYIIEKFPDVLNIYNIEKDYEFINDLMKEWEKIFLSDEIKQIFYENYHLILKFLPNINNNINYYLSKNFLIKIFYFIKDDKENFSLKNMLNNKNNNNNSNFNSSNNPSLDISNTYLPSSKKTKITNYCACNTDSSNVNNNLKNDLSNNLKKNFEKSYLININDIFKEMLEIKNDVFVYFIIERINSFYGIMLEIKDWRIVINMIKSLEQLPKYLLFNYNKFPNFNEINLKIFQTCQNIFKNNLNILIEQELTKLLCEIILYDNFNRSAVLEYIKGNFLNNKSYFRRRIYMLFSESAFEKFSIYLIKEKNIINELNDLLLNDNVLIKTWVIKIFNIYCIFDKEITINIKLIQEQQKKIEKMDLLLNIEIKRYFISYNEYQKNDKKSKNMDKEKEKEESELKIFKIEQEVLKQKKKEETETNNNNNTNTNNHNHSIIMSKNKLKNLINNLPINLSNNKNGNRFGNSIRVKQGSMNKKITIRRDSLNNNKRKNSDKSSEIEQINNRRNSYFANYRNTSYGNKIYHQHRSKEKYP